MPAVGRARGWPRKGQGRVSWGRESWDQTVVTAPSSPACPEPRTAHSKMANVMCVDSISVFKNIRARVSTHGVGGSQLCGRSEGAGVGPGSWRTLFLLLLGSGPTRAPQPPAPGPHTEAPTADQGHGMAPRAAPCWPLRPPW